MNNGWKIWFGLLGLVSLYGFVLVENAQSAADLNEALASGAPQQTVVGLWQLHDLTTAVIFEIIVLIVAVASVGILVATEREAPVATTQPIRTPDSDPEVSDPELT